MSKQCVVIHKTDSRRRPTITYRNTARGGTSHRQYAQKILAIVDVWTSGFEMLANRQTYRHVYHSTWHPDGGEVTKRESDK